MKKSVMKKWVKALRSGEYRQCKSQLVDNKDNFCCLGVLCNIAPDSLGLDWVKITTDYWEIGGESCELPIDIIDWAGMEYDTSVDEGQGYLAGLNDGEGRSFDYIADYIEKNWEKL